MIDALRREAWPRGVRRVRRELEAAREALRRELGHEPSLADLAARVGSDEKRLGRTIVRINTIESTSPLASADHLNEASLPAVLVPSEPEAPDAAFERSEVQQRIREAMATLPARERRLIGLYYFGEVTMKQIGAELGVNESRVSQLHARAIQRLRQALGTTATPAMARATALPRVALKVAVNVMPFVAAPRPEAARPAAAILRSQILAFRAPKPKMAKAGIAPTYAITSCAMRSRSASRNGFGSHRQPVSSRNRSASVPATSPVTKTTRRASGGFATAMAR
jgi:RNA polymerase sigma factor for flagellar operon FliA